ncbi:carbohydrate ABC transporter permease [Lachnospiraceae bacterium MD1]|jgi:putative aldouronate transport system permease protein|uniref:Carbohydrate ABC transporter permease n=2 Tax=Variimorphobacter saccharofermentans TaxID=2755051 RepID=A0A839K087_9FIRM|nr:carbohydrate ABC transporter permease [Variimorphobacter saccharofermentans]
MKMKKRGNKKSAADYAFITVNTIILVLFCVVTLYPILNTLAISLNEGMDAIKGGIYLWPRRFTWENYYTVIKKDNLLTAIKISVLRTVIATFLHMFTTALLAYVLSRKEFLFNRSVTLFYVLTMYVSGGLVPTMLLFKGLHLTNNFWVYIIPGMVSAFNMIVIRTYMNGLPDGLVESAQVDGAGHMRIFFRIIIPLCKPVLAVVALFIAVGQWNSWFDSMIYNPGRPDLTTLQFELQKLLTSVSMQSGSASTMKNAKNAVTPVSIRSATAIFTALPIVCLYPFLQRYFIAGLTIGGVKE